MGWKKITSEAQVGKILSTMTMEPDTTNFDKNAKKVSQGSQNDLLFMREVSYLSLKIHLLFVYLCYNIFHLPNRLSVCKLL